MIELLRLWKQYGSFKLLIGSFACLGFMYVLYGLIYVIGG